MPLAISNGNGGSAYLMGIGTYNNRLHYLSCIGTSQPLRALRATIVTGHRLFGDKVDGVTHEKGAKFVDFRAAIPNSTYHHWIWVTLDPSIMTIVDPSAVMATLRKSEFPDDAAFHQAHVDRNNVREQLLNSDMPARLVRSITTNMDVPLVPEWAPRVAEKARLKQLIRPGACSGDCVEIYKITDDSKQWKELTIELLTHGLVV